MKSIARKAFNIFLLLLKDIAIKKGGFISKTYCHDILSGERGKIFSKFTSKAQSNKAQSKSNKANNYFDNFSSDNSLASNGSRGRRIFSFYNFFMLCLLSLLFFSVYRDRGFLDSFVSKSKGLYDYFLSAVTFEFDKPATERLGKANIVKKGVEEEEEVKKGVKDERLLVKEAVQDEEPRSSRSSEVLQERGFLGLTKDKEGSSNGLVTSTDQGSSSSFDRIILNLQPLELSFPKATDLATAKEVVKQYIVYKDHLSSGTLGIEDLFIVSRVSGSGDTEQKVDILRQILYSKLSDYLFFVTDFGFYSNKEIVLGAYKEYEDFLLNGLSGLSGVDFLKDFGKRNGQRLKYLSIYRDLLASGFHLSGNNYEALYALSNLEQQDLDSDLSLHLSYLSLHFAKTVNLEIEQTNKLLKDSGDYLSKMKSRGSRGSRGLLSYDTTIAVKFLDILNRYLKSYLSLGSSESLDRLVWTDAKPMYLSSGKFGDSLKAFNSIYNDRVGSSFKDGSLVKSDLEGTDASSSSSLLMIRVKKEFERLIWDSLLILDGLDQKNNFYYSILQQVLNYSTTHIKIDFIEKIAFDFIEGLILYNALDLAFFRSIKLSELLLVVGNHELSSRLLLKVGPIKSSIKKDMDIFNYDRLLLWSSYLGSGIREKNKLEQKFLLDAESFDKVLTFTSKIKASLTYLTLGIIKFNISEFTISCKYLDLGYRSLRSIDSSGLDRDDKLFVIRSMNPFKAWSKAASCGL